MKIVRAMALKVILEFILGNFNFFTSNRMFHVILVCAENGISLFRAFRWSSCFVMHDG